MTDWQKKSIKYSVWFFVFLIIIVVLGFIYMPYSQNPAMMLSETERFTRFGNLIGFIFGIGMVAIWLLNYKSREKIN